MAPRRRPPKKKPAARGGSRKGPRKSARKSARKPARKSSRRRPARVRPDRRSSRKPRRPARRRGGGFGRALRRLTLTALGAATLGAGLVLAVLYGQARDQVGALLAGEVWEDTGSVWSAPISVWPGLAVTPEELAGDLQRAGYARVAKATEPGDFSISGDALLVRGRGSPGEILITFQGGRVATTSPVAHAVFGPARLASVRGAGNEERSPRPLSAFPEALQDAILAMEDEDFWEHRGVSLWAITRALVSNTLDGERSQGGSTLTQQLAKNLFLSPERTYARKARELLFAFALEERLEKGELLALYLNEIYWGQVGGAAICGADQAARVYFGKAPERLTLGEAATLGGVISAPNTYSPLRHPERARERRDLALRRMVEEGLVHPDAARAAMAEPLRTHPAPVSRAAPFAVDAALEEVEARLGGGAVLRDGLSVHTTIHPALQRLAERAVAEGLAEVEGKRPKAKGVQAALVALRVEDGAIVAMVGGRDYGASQYNRAALARRQIGSTVKPLTMLAALEQDRALSPASRFDDEALEIELDGKTWAPKNYDGEFEGELRLRALIARRRNVPSVHLAQHVGLRRLQSFLKGAGLPGATRLPSAALGAFEATPLELAGAYSAFPNGGRAQQPALVRAVRDAGGDEVESARPSSRKVASPRATYMAHSVLESVMREGTGAGARRYGLTEGVAGKTGTTDGNRDAWFVGYTAELVVVVWVGFDRTGSTGLTGASGALPIWSRFVSWSGTAEGGLERPDDVVEAEVCLGEWEDGECTECGSELFSDGYEPEDGCEMDRGVKAIAERVRARRERRVGESAWDAIERELDDEGAPRKRRLFRRRGR